MRTTLHDNTTTVTRHFNTRSSLNQIRHCTMHNNAVQNNAVEQAGIPTLQWRRMGLQCNSDSIIATLQQQEHHN